MAMRRYLLIPAMPTPNGRFHLGHLAGPYLKLDVLARHLRRGGAEASVMCGIDAYESHVLLAAEREWLSPEQVCHRNSAHMIGELRALSIDVDVWCNPLEPAAAARFRRSHVAPIKEMAARGALEQRAETVLYCEARRRYVVGCWLLGRCPLCDAEVGGYCCERCGYHFLPEEVVAPRDRQPGGELVPRRVSCTHLRLPERERLVATPGVPAALRGMIDSYLERRAGRFRQTIPGSWGLRMPWPWSEDQVVFSYGAVGYALYLGDAYAELHPTVGSPFEVGSNVTVVMSCGVDNVVPLCVGMQGALLAIGRRPIDGFLVNWFLDLEGQKFSTSRGHAIAPGAWLERTPMTADELRYVLCRIHPGAGPSDLRIDEVARIVGEELVPLGAAIERLGGALRPGQAPAPPGGEIARLVLAELSEQAAALAPLGCELARAAAQLRRLWAAPPPDGDPDRSYWWLKGVALLSAPILPALGAALWRQLGGAGPVAEAALWERTAPTERVRGAALPAVTAAALRSACPALGGELPAT